jgi:glycosyltransferase involved in cell wall biosynthesis
MAAGIPVMAGNRSALPEVCGPAAELINPASEEEISAALIRLEGDQCRREELIALGIERAKHFRWKDAVASTLAVYRELT